MKEVKSVFFDMDGVIIDSMGLHAKCWVLALKEHGVSISLRDVYLHEGEKGEKTLQHFFKINGRELDKEISDSVFSLYKRYFRENFSVIYFDGVKDCLNYLVQKGVYIGIVTGTSDKKVIGEVVDGLPVKMSHVLSGADVVNGKPHPEPYLRALEMFGHKACESIVVENAPFGIQSAKEAGIYTVALETSLPAEHLSNADKIFPNMRLFYEDLCGRHKSMGEE